MEAPVEPSRRVALTFREHEFEHAQPAPLFAGIVGRWPDVRDEHFVIATIVSELFINALDHGVLGLDSELRSAAQFETFTGIRSAAITRRKGRVKVTVELRGFDAEWEITVAVADSGPGYDAAKLAPTSSEDAFGRGLELVRGLASSFETNAAGNVAIATVRYPRPQSMQSVPYAM